MRRRMCAAGLGLLVGIATLGCAQERDTINRVQPDALQKSFFLGEDLQSTADDPVFWKRSYNVRNSSGMDSFESSVSRPPMVTPHSPRLME